MQEEEPQRRAVGVVGELQHGGVPVGVSRCEERASADLVPDPHRLLRAVGHHPYGVATLPVVFDEADLHHDRLGAT